MIIYFVCGTTVITPKKGLECTYPTVQLARDSHGQFPCRWAITDGHAAGVMDVTAKQRAAVEALTGVFTFEDSRKATPVSQMPEREKDNLRVWLSERNIVISESTETMDALLMRVVQTAQPGWDRSKVAL